MEHTVKMINLINSKDSYMQYEEETVCPICKASISPTYLASSLNNREDASIFNACPACHNSFVTYYGVYVSGKATDRNVYYCSTIISSEPNKFFKKSFDKSISTLSPQFDKIYNQALAAESYGLDEIAGLGYRKSLEFLVKDFAIKLHPDSIEEIKKLMLSPCIKKYIENDQIRTLVERSAWIGNDEAHYVRKQQDRDVNDMKAFIKATVYFIGMYLISEDAASIEAVK